MTQNYDGTSAEYKLNNPPNDCIQSVKFGQVDNHHLLAASWDRTVRLYDVIANQQRTQYMHDAPVLDVTFQGNNHCWSGGADRKVKRYDFQSQTEVTVGYHKDTVRCVDYIQDLNLVATGSWDNSVKLWDPRLVDSSRVTPISSFTLPDKVYGMSACGEQLIIGTAKRNVFLADIRKMTCKPRNSFLRYQIRCIEAFADRQGYVVGSIEGRISVEYLDPAPEVQKQKYAFKCHRLVDAATKTEIIYPINAVSFHRRFNSFATGGSDGFVSIWDGTAKKRIIQYRRYPTSISSLSFSRDGSMLAVACSPMNISDDSDNPSDISSDCIYLRRVSDNEARTNIS